MQTADVVELPEEFEHAAVATALAVFMVRPGLALLLL
jgi:hypothetical protein